MKRTTKGKKDNKETTKGRRFYRSNLSTIVWDIENDRALADFTEGHFTTEDDEVAEILLEKGYIEIPLDSTEPPSVIVNQPAVVLKEGAHIPVITPGMSEKGIQKRMEAVTEKTGPVEVPSFEPAKG